MCTKMEGELSTSKYMYAGEGVNSSVVVRVIDAQSAVDITEQIL